MQWRLLFLLLCSISAARLSPVQAAKAAECSLYTRHSDGATWFDCRPNAGVCCYGNAEYASSRRLFVGIRRGDSRIHWELAPPLLDTQAVNHLPPDAFLGLDSRLNDSAVLVLRRLHQASFSLAALSALPSLRHLALRESNVTCLPAGAFTSASGGRLLTLELLDNSDLECIQPGAFDGLDRLRGLRIAGSPRLQRLHPGAFCGLRGLVSLELRLPPGAAVPESSLSRLPASLAELRLARDQQPADDTAALEFLPGLPAFVCARSPGLELNGLTVSRLLSDQLRVPLTAFCADTGAGGGTSAEAPFDCPEPWPTRPATPGRALVLVKSGPLPEPPRDIAAPPEPPSPAAPAPIAAAAAAAGPRPTEQSSNLIGTAVLTSCAFAAGVVVSLYCVCFLQRRRLRKPPRAAALAEAAAEAPAVSVVAASEEPVRLIGFRSRPDADHLEGQVFIVHKF